jgi:nitrous oxidase accessory protein NosD
MKSTVRLHSPFVYFLVLALIMIQIFGAFSLTVQAVNANSKTIIVPDNYATIGAAIGNASRGDTILVKKGTYQENPVIDKSISVLGEDVIETVVIGAGGVQRGAKSVFTITADNVVLSKFTVRSSNYSSSTYYATGIKVNARNCNITDNMITNTYYGIFSSFLTSSAIVENNVTAALKDGIRICGGSQNTIANNSIDKNAVSGIAIDGYSDIIADNSLCGNGRGIGLGASYCAVYCNNISGNMGIGLYMGGSDNLVTANNISQNVWGVYLTSDFTAPNNNTVCGNSFVNNSGQVVASLTSNSEIWDSGSQGNYWSNYNGNDTNKDGVGDTPYEVYVCNLDRYPLINQPNLTLGVQPPLPVVPKAIKGAVSYWQFDEVKPNRVAPDTLGNNPVVVETSNGILVGPLLVDGKSGAGLRFNGSDYAYVAASPTLDVKGEVTVEAWVNVQQYKNVAYNIIISECVRTQDQYPTRIFGFAINGVSAENSSSPPVGALRGFFYDDKGVFNEIVTAQPVVPLNQWTHVVFVRSFSSGMNIYVNGVEQTVQVTSGVQNPQGAIADGSEFYIGHDSFSTLDDLAISTIAVEQPTPTIQPTLQPTQTAEPTSQPQSMQVWGKWWFWTSALAGFAMLATAVFFAKRRGNQANA